MESDSYLTFALVCGNASHAGSRVRVCFFLGAVTSLTFRSLIGRTQQRSGSALGF